MAPRRLLMWRRIFHSVRPLCIPPCRRGTLPSATIAAAARPDPGIPSSRLPGKGRRRDKGECHSPRKRSLPPHSSRATSLHPMAPIGNVDELAGKYPAAAVDLHAIAAAVWDVGSGRPMKMNERRCRQTCCIAGFGLLFHPRQSFAGSRGAVLLPRDNAQKESRAKALPQSAHNVPVDSHWYYYGVAAIFSRRPFSSHRLGPQPSERKIIADTRSIQRISYSYLIPVQFVTMVVVHCTITQQNLTERGGSAISGGRTC
jgi:hypothetical protein